MAASRRFSTLCLVIVSCALLVSLVSCVPASYLASRGVTPVLIKRSYLPATARASQGSGLGWKLPFSRPSFLSALTDSQREDDFGSAVPASHLLPEYLMHQEFLKPQLQAAGYSGGRIIAGPFPVPLSSLPKPAQVRAGANTPPQVQQIPSQAPPALNYISKQPAGNVQHHSPQPQQPPQPVQPQPLQLAPQPQPVQPQQPPQHQPQQVYTQQQQLSSGLAYSAPQPSTGGSNTLIYNPPPLSAALSAASSSSPSHLIYNPPQPSSHLIHGHSTSQTLLVPAGPYQKPAHQSAAPNGHYIVKTPIPPPPPPHASQSKPVHHHQQVPVKLAYNYPSELPTYSSASTGKTPPNYPVYQSSAASPLNNVRPIQAYSIPAQVPSASSSSASSSSDVQVSYGGWTPIYSPGVRPVEYRPQEVALQPQVETPKSPIEATRAAKPESAPAPAPAAPAPSSSEETQELNDFDLQNLEFGNIFGDFGGGFGALASSSASSRSSNEDDEVADADSYAAASSSSSSVPRVVILNATEGDESVLAGETEEAEERADQQQEEYDEHGDGEPRSIPADSSSVKRGGQGKRKAKQESSFTVTQTETDQLPALAADQEAAAPVDAPARGRGQGRFVGRVLPASVFDDDLMSAGSDMPLMASPVRWRQIVAQFQQDPFLPSSQSSIGYTLRFNESR